MFKFLAKFFNIQSEVRFSKESDIVNYSLTVLSGTGLYASNSMSADWSKWEIKMEKDLEIFEQYSKKYLSSTLYTITGQGWENFSIWYRRKKDDKKTPLQKAIVMFEEALKIDPNNEEAKTSLASVLVERIQVRDLNYAAVLLSQIKNKTGQVDEMTNKIKRWTGNITHESSFDYTKISLIPLGDLREERKKCRALVRKFKKEKLEKELKEVLNHMYRIAILHDAATYVMLSFDYSLDQKKDKIWDKKLNMIAKNVKQYSYIGHGKIKESNNCFLSNNDYKTFESIFGETENIFNPKNLIK